MESVNFEQLLDLLFGELLSCEHRSEFGSVVLVLSPPHCDDLRFAAKLRSAACLL